MVFSSYTFLFLFLPSTCFVYLLLPFRLKNIWLLLTSLVFYGWNNPSSLIILFVSIIINWGSGILIDRSKNPKPILVCSLVLNLLILIYYKYANFIVSNLSVAFPALNESWKTVVLPLGISFFTFQGISYVIDVYCGDGQVLKNLLDVGLYISLFPQLVAGPIVRFKTVAEEIKNRRSTVSDIAAGFRRFTYGLSKKALLANTFGMIADDIFAASSWSLGSSWIGILAYTLQIYFDFSGYSDMAIGLGRIFGFHFDENFDYPYIAQSITDFWKRWHISLSRWFRDYVYIPCGGNRVPIKRQAFNIFLVWLLTGIWHGANWTFIAWGVYYAVLLLIEKFLLKNLLPHIPKVFRHLITMLLVTSGWVLFRADSVSAAMSFLRSMYFGSINDPANIVFFRYLINYRFFWLAGLIGIFPVKYLLQKVSRLTVWGNNTICITENVYVLVLFLLSVLFIITGNYNAFIYFQF